MKKLFVFLLLLMFFSMPSYAQIWEGGGGVGIEEGIEFGSGSGGWIPEPLDPNMTHYVISFKDDNQTTSLFSPIELNENTVVDLSVFTPSRSVGYDFSHWEDGNGNTVTTVTMTADTSIYAVWIAHTHSITWRITDNSKTPAVIYTSVVSNVAYGTVIVASDTPTVPSNYEFSEWEYPATMPDYDLLVAASIDYVNIVYKLKEIPRNSADPTQSQRYQIVYDGTITNYAPITYSNGVVNMGDWESWINKHFKPVMLKSDGTVDYELSRSNQNYKADGVTPSDISNINYDGNAMLQIKKFYISCSTESETSDGVTYNVHTIRISDTKKDNTFTCWGFVDADGVEHDYVYYSLYLGHIDSNSKLRSIAGIDLSQNTSYGDYSTFDAAARANGNGWAISNLALENAVGLVMMMIYKDVNPYFVNREYLSGTTTIYTQDVSVNKTTGTRANTGGCPYSLNTEQAKALWIESYWQAVGGTYCNWVNGLSSRKVTGAYKSIGAFYRLQEPFDLSAVNDWSYMNNTSLYVYQSQSHQLGPVTFYDNIMFQTTDQTIYGSVQGISLYYYCTSNFGGGDINAGSSSYNNREDILYAGRTGGWIRTNVYDAPSHFLSYALYGTRTGHTYADGGARLTYLPQPASLANINRQIQSLSLQKSELQPVVEEEEKQLDVIATDSKELDK